MAEFLIFLPCAVACGILRLRASAHSWNILPFSGKFHRIFRKNKKETFTGLPNFLPLTYSASENLGMTVKVSFLSYLIHYFFMDSITHSCFFVLLS